MNRAPKTFARHASRDKLNFTHHFRRDEVVKARRGGDGGVVSELLLFGPAAHGGERIGDLNQAFIEFHRNIGLAMGGLCGFIA